MKKSGHATFRFLHGWRLKRCEIKTPVEGIVQRLEVGELHLVVHLDRIAARGDVERSLGQRGFEAHDGVGLFIRVGRGNTEQLHHARDVRDILFARFDGFGIGAEVVIFFG